MECIKEGDHVECATNECRGVRHIKDNRVRNPSILGGGPRTLDRARMRVEAEES
jgi:hypothetical protein